MSLVWRGGCGGGHRAGCGRQLCMHCCSPAGRHVAPATWPRRRYCSRRKIISRRLLRSGHAHSEGGAGGAGGGGEGGARGQEVLGGGGEDGRRLRRHEGLLQRRPHIRRVLHGQQVLQDAHLRWQLRRKGLLGLHPPPRLGSPPPVGHPHTLWGTRTPCVCRPCPVHRVGGPGLVAWHGISAPEGLLLQPPGMAGLPRPSCPAARRRRRSGPLQSPEGGCRTTRPRPSADGAGSGAPARGADSPRGAAASPGPAAAAAAAGRVATVSWGRVLCCRCNA